jgi:5-formyltetrahydrofolate cyclo-ligase
VASVTDTSGHRLTHYSLDPSTALQVNRWEIPEPISDGQLPIDVAQIDLVLVPLLAFDVQGHRVGYGGGYYDRFLADCRSDCRKVGLSLFESVTRIDNPDATDIPLNSCITPTQLTVFI